jgi:hypothetical protein
MPCVCNLEETEKGSRDCRELGLDDYVIATCGTGLAAGCLRVRPELALRERLRFGQEEVEEDGGRRKVTCFLPHRVDFQQTVGRWYRELGGEQVAP